MNYTVSIGVRAISANLKTLKSVYGECWTEAGQPSPRIVTDGAALRRNKDTHGVGGVSLYNAVLKQPLGKRKLTRIDIYQQIDDDVDEEKKKSDPYLLFETSTKTKLPRKVEMRLRLDPDLGIKSLLREIEPNGGKPIISSQVEPIGGTYIWRFVPEQGNSYKLKWECPKSEKLTEG